jgi:sarcosine oxidase subunit gamma
VADLAQRQTALAGLGLAADGAPAGGGVRMVEVAHTGKIDLRGDATDEAFATAVREAVGVELPLVPLTSTHAGAATVLWLGPDEWLIACEAGAEAAMAQALRTALEGVPCAITDFTEAQTIVRISGPRARDLIAKGCTLDLHPRVFGLGRVARSTLAHAAVVLHQTASEGDADGPAFDLYVARSFAEHLWRWLADAAAEYVVAAAD